MNIGIVENFLANFFDKKEYAVHTKTLKQALKNKLELKAVHRVAKLNQNDWLKPYSDMNTELRKKTKNDFKKHFFKLMTNASFFFLEKLAVRKEEIICCQNEFNNRIRFDTSNY